jgi:hypothetical protein
MRDHEEPCGTSLLPGPEWYHGSVDRYKAGQRTILEWFRRSTRFAP